MNSLSAKTSNLKTKLGLTDRLLRRWSNSPSPDLSISTPSFENQKTPLSASDEPSLALFLSAKALGKLPETPPSNSLILEPPLELLLQTKNDGDTKKPALKWLSPLDIFSKSTSVGAKPLRDLVKELSKTGEGQPAGDPGPSRPRLVSEVNTTSNRPLGVNGEFQCFHPRADRANIYLQPMYHSDLEEDLILVEYPTISLDEDTVQRRVSARNRSMLESFSLRPVSPRHTESGAWDYLGSKSMIFHIALKLETHCKRIDTEISRSLNVRWDSKTVEKCLKATNALVGELQRLYDDLDLLPSAHYDVAEVVYEHVSHIADELEHIYQSICYQIEFEKNGWHLTHKKRSLRWPKLLGSEREMKMAEKATKHIIPDIKAFRRRIAKEVGMKCLPEHASSPLSFYYIWRGLG